MFFEVQIFKVKCDFFSGRGKYLSMETDFSTVAVVDRWSLFGGPFCYKSSKWDVEMVVVNDRWSLFEGGR
jgi:hypothetical protein